MAQLQQRLQMQQQRQQQEADAAALLQGQHTFVDEGLLLPDELIPSSSMRMPHAPSPPLASAPNVWMVHKAGFPVPAAYFGQLSH
eukprot:scaffold86025_cov18-Tisochrysis_lutea.AAC.2